MQANDDMAGFYAHNNQHYENGLVRIGCSIEQATAYGSLFNRLRKEYQKIVNTILYDYPDGSVVCDVGMGMGHDIEYFARQHPGKQFVGVELSENTVEIVNGRIQAAKLENVVLDSDEFWYERSEKFDLVINNCVFEHVSDPSKFAEQIKESLKPSGQFVFVVPSHSYWMFWQLLFLIPMLPVRGIPKTHSVFDQVMKKCIREAGMVLVSKGAYGFRPPQSYFCYAKTATIRRIQKRQVILEQILRNMKLGHCLYLNIYVGHSSKPAKGSALSEKVRQLIENRHHFSGNVSFSDYVFFMKVYLHHIISYPYFVLRKLQRKK